MSLETTFVKVRAADRVEPSEEEERMWALELNGTSLSGILLG